MSDKIYKDLFDAFVGDIKITWYERIYYYLRRKFRDTQYFFMKILQTLRHGYPDWHVFDFKSWHSEAVAPKLKRLKKSKDGYPGTLSSHDEWQEILEKMIWSFEHHDDSVEPIYSDDFDHRYKKEVSDEYVTLIPLNETGTVDWTPVREHEKRVQEGLDLFAKYYWNLWS